MRALRSAKIKIVCDQSFHDDDIEPAALETRMFLVDADLTKAMFAAKSATGQIEWKNARQKFP